MMSMLKVLAQSGVGLWPDGNFFRVFELKVDENFKISQTQVEISFFKINFAWMEENPQKLDYFLKKGLVD